MPHATLILRNARIFTADSRLPWAQSVACLGDRILAVGDDALTENLSGPETEVMDMAGRLILPGFIDSHAHLLSYAVQRQQVDLFGVDSLDEVRRRVRRATEGAPAGAWFLGGGWDELHWDERPHRRLLDDICGQHPVVLKRMDLHTWWVNSVAMTAAGISATTPNSAERGVERDADGRPSGILREWNAIGLVEPHIPSPTWEKQLEWLRQVIQEAHELGITGVHDQRVLNEGEVSFRLFQHLLERELLDLRIHMNISTESLAWAGRLGLRTGFGSDRLWLGHVKAFADGSMGSGTALMIDPYEGQPNNRGVAALSPEQLRVLVDRAARAGFPLSVHAIGDLAVRRVVDVLRPSNVQVAEAVGRGKTPPHRIEHVQVVHPADIPRLAQTGAVAAVQPVHLVTDWQTADRVWGSRARYAYAFNSLLRHGITLAFGSDTPVAPWNPLLGIHAAVTRLDERDQPAGGWFPEERIGLADAVRAYTMGSACAAGKGTVQGSITPGKWADMIVLSDDLFVLPVETIREARVLLTVFAGHVVHNLL